MGAEEGDERHEPFRPSSGAPAIPDEDIKELHAKATGARKYGRRPYSEFPVAAAVLTSSGTTLGGAEKVECANYTLTKHAEETAIIQALADGELKRSGRAFIRAIYLPATDGPKRVMPCGGCRQFMWEFSDTQNRGDRRGARQRPGDSSPDRPPEGAFRTRRCRQDRKGQPGLTTPIESSSRFLSEQRVSVSRPVGETSSHQTRLAEIRIRRA
jgi:cytidine deaminase